MKFLVLFCDMLRPNLLNIYNPEAPERELDRAFKRIGGTLYTNCFTPSPDTPRSLACFWSGQPPWVNGCDSRLKYPKYYLKVPSFLDLIKSCGYDMNFYELERVRMTGGLPRGYDEIGHHNKEHDLTTYLSELRISENSFTYISLPDFHWAMDDYMYTNRGVERGAEILADAFKIIDNALGFDNFDYVLVFSDHGCKLEGQLREDNKSKFLNRDRTNIVMLLREKGHKGIVRNDKLCSIVDVFPTICDIMQMPCEVMGGHSLRSSQSHDHIVVEDYYSYTAEPIKSPSVWAVIKENGMYFRYADGSYCYDNKSAFDIIPEQLDRLIASHFPIFREHLEISNIHLLLYKQSNIVTPSYSNGDKRTPSTLYRSIIKIRHKLYYYILKISRKLFVTDK